MKKILIDQNYYYFLNKANISVEEVLKRARLPEDLFSRETPTLSREEYYRFVQTIENLSNDDELPIKLATIENIETFSPPIFAAYCSKNAEVCIKRLSFYKPIIGVLKYVINDSEKFMSVEICSEDVNDELPEILVGIEFVFLLNLIRKATKENIVPIFISSKNKFINQKYSDFIEKDIVAGTKNEIVFSKKDLELPFVSSNESMWNFFEPELKKRLSMVDTNDTFSTKVRSALIELLPSGECTIDDVAKKMFTSKRTIQRKLQIENTNFQKQLNYVREMLAKNYIEKTKLKVEDIAYLLGYQDINSFLRAFNTWTGMSVSSYKKNL